MKLTVLGSGSPEAYVRRASSGHLLEISGQRILLTAAVVSWTGCYKRGFSPLTSTFCFSRIFIPII